MLVAVKLQPVAKAPKFLKSFNARIPTKFAHEPQKFLPESSSGSELQSVRNAGQDTHFKLRTKIIFKNTE